MILLSELANEHVDIDQQSTKVKTFLIEKNRLVKDTETKMLITFTNNCNYSSQSLASSLANFSHSL